MRIRSPLGQHFFRATSRRAAPSSADAAAETRRITAAVSSAKLQFTVWDQAWRNGQIHRALDLSAALIATAQSIPSGTVVSVDTKMPRLSFAAVAQWQPRLQNLQPTVGPSSATLTALGLWQPNMPRLRILADCLQELRRRAMTVRLPLYGSAYHFMAFLLRLEGPALGFALPGVSLHSLASYRYPSLKAQIAGLAPKVAAQTVWISAGRHGAFVHPTEAPNSLAMTLNAASDALAACYKTFRLHDASRAAHWWQCLFTTQRRDAFDEIIEMIHTNACVEAKVTDMQAFLTRLPLDADAPNLETLNDILSTDTPHEQVTKYLRMFRAQQLTAYTQAHGGDPEVDCAVIEESPVYRQTYFNENNFLTYLKRFGLLAGRTPEAIEDLLAYQRDVIGIL